MKKFKNFALGLLLAIGVVSQVQAQVNPLTPYPADNIMASPVGSSGPLAVRAMNIADFPPAPPSVGSGATLVVLSSYNGTIINWNNGSSTWYGFLPTVGTLGVVESGFQVIILNTGTAEATICAVTTPSTATNCSTTTSTIGGSATIAIPPGSGVNIAADSATTSYEAVPVGIPGNGTTETMGTNETTAYNFPGSSALTTFSGNVLADGYIKAAALIPLGATIPSGAGIYLPTTCNLGFSTNGSEAGYIDCAQNWHINNLSTYSLIANSSAGTLASIAYGASGSFLRGNGTTTAPSFSTNTIPNTDTLGDTWYASATNTISALAGNTTSTKKFYTQTGTGSASAAPGWNTIVSGDIPNNAANTTGTAANLSGTPALPNGTTATTQSLNDSTNDLATDSFVANAIASALPNSNPAPTVGCVSGCPANNTGVAVSVGFSTNSSSITGTSMTWVPGEAVTLSAASYPTNFPAGTYYVNSTGLSTTGLQLCSAPPTLSFGSWSACSSISTGSSGSAGSTVTLTGISPGNYINYASTGTSGFIVLPEGTYPSATTLNLTFSKSATNGYECHATDLTAAALMLQTGVFTATVCRIAKASAASALDVVVWGTEGPT